MSARVICPNCHTSLNAADDLLGQKIMCEECGTTFIARSVSRSRSESADSERRTSSRPRRDDYDDYDYDDEDDRPRSRRASRYEDDRPRRRTKRKKTNSALPLILVGGGLLLLFLVLGVVGVVLLLTNRSETRQAKNAPMAPPAVNNRAGFAPIPPAAPGLNNPPPQAPAAANPPPAGVEKIRLSNPRWTFGGFGGDFDVDYQLISDEQFAGLRWVLKWKHADGNSGSANLHITPFDGPSGTWTIQVIGPGAGHRGGPIQIWVEEGGHDPHRSGTRVSNIVTLN